MVQQLMEAEVTRLVGAAPGERVAEERLAKWPRVSITQAVETFQASGRLDQDVSSASRAIRRTVAQVDQRPRRTRSRPDVKA